MSLSRFRFANAPAAIPQSGSSRDTIRRLVLLSAAFATLAWLALSAPNSAFAHHPGSQGDEGRIRGLGDFKRHGDTTYRFLPAKGGYEVRVPGQPPLFLHQDSD